MKKNPKILGFMVAEWFKFNELKSQTTEIKVISKINLISCSLYK